MRTILIVAADTLDEDARWLSAVHELCEAPCASRGLGLVLRKRLSAFFEEALSPLRAAFLRLDGWCPDGMLTARGSSQVDS